MYKIISNTTDFDYKKWKLFYEDHVRDLFNHIIEQLDDKNILYMNYDFELFCKLVYNKSSKRIPLH